MEVLEVESLKGVGHALDFMGKGLITWRFIKSCAEIFLFSMNERTSLQR